MWNKAYWLPYRLIRYGFVFFHFVLAMLTLLILIDSYYFTFYRVKGQSMIPTLRNDQVVVVWRLARNFERGDVVVVRYPGKQFIVKRLAGLPKETVSIDGRTINLRENQYYLLGDNKISSTDSRQFGAVDESQIVGRVLGY